MADNDAALQQESDNSRAAEWARLEAEDGGGQQEAPGADTVREPADEQGDKGQASSPPADPAAEKPAGSDTAATTDLWANADPALKAEFEKAQNLIRTQTGRLQASERRFVELNGEVTTLREKVKPPEKEAEPGPVLTDEAKNTLREEYPDVAAPLLDLIGGLEKTVNDLKAAGATQAEQREAADKLEAQRIFAAEEQRLADKHPDWSAEVAKPEFTTWAQAQPRYIREALVRNGNGIVDADEAIDIVARWKASAGGQQADSVAARREAQLNGGRMPTARTTVATPSTTTDREAEWKRLDAIDRQRERARSNR